MIDSFHVANHIGICRCILVCHKCIQSRQAMAWSNMSVSDVFWVKTIRESSMHFLLKNVIRIYHQFETCYTYFQVRNADKKKVLLWRICLALWYTRGNHVSCGILFPVGYGFVQKYLFELALHKYKNLHWKTSQNLESANTISIPAFVTKVYYHGRDICLFCKWQRLKLSILNLDLQLYK